MSNTDIRTSSVYLVIERATWRYDPPRVVAMRVNKPSLAAGQIAVKVSLRIPMAMFGTFIPEVTAELAEANILVPELVVQPTEVTE